MFTEKKEFEINSRIIFKRFYELGDYPSHESGVTGLGLAIVKDIVEAHGGKVCNREHAW